MGTPFSKSFVYFDVGVVFGVSVEFEVFEGVVEGPDVLPEFFSLFVRAKRNLKFRLRK